MAALLEKIQASFKSDKNGASPKVPSEEEVQDLKERYKKAGQDHVFAFYDDLSTPEKATLYEQLSGFDPARITELAKTALDPPKEEGKAEPVVEPLPSEACASILDSPKDAIEDYTNKGLKLISENKVGIVLLAGGQGTRLGSSAPKGCYDIGLPSQKSLFQLQAERILKLQQLAQKQFGKSEGDVVVPWYVMTSGPTRQPTEEFFEKNGYFGLKKENLIVFEQGILPCIANDGKILLESKSKV